MNPSPPPSWRIEKSAYPHGDLYELTVRITYKVFHTSFEQPIYIFIEENEADYKGKGWEETRSSGVRSLEIKEDESCLILHYHKGTSYKLPLRPPFEEQLLTLDETEQLMPFFLDYQKKEQYWRYTDAWSYDISIPAEAIDLAKKQSKEALDSLEHQLFLLGLRQHQTIIQVPQRASKKRGYSKVNLKDLYTFLNNT